MSASTPATQSQIQEELHRVLVSRQFADSPRLSRFLAFAVEKALAGETDEIKEYTIGLAVFDRPASFDPRLETIVRVQASKLRSRLNDYYGSEGRSNSVQIRLPRGSYIPVFEYPAEAVLPVTLEGSTPSAARRRLWLAAGLATALAFAAGFTVALGTRPQPPRTGQRRFEVPAPEGCRFLGSPRLSPDGKKLAVAVFRKAEADTAIYVHSLESGAGELIPGTSGGLYPFWAFDGRSLIFSKANKSYRVDLVGGTGVAPVTAVASAFGVDSNREGVLLFAGNPGPVRRLSPSGGGMTAVTKADKPEVQHVFPHFLPDGNHFLYLARNETPGDSALCAGSLDGKTKKCILQTETRAAFVSAPSGNSSSGYILFVRNGELLAQPFDAARLELSGSPWRVTGNIQQLPYGASTYSVASSVLAYVTEAGDKGQFTWFDRSGNVIGKLGPVAALGDPAISPDGSRVAYDQAEGANRDVWTIEINSEKPTRITFDPEVDHVPVWSPDGRRIAFESHRTPPGFYVAGSQGGRGNPWCLRAATLCRPGRLMQPFSCSIPCGLNPGRFRSGWGRSAAASRESGCVPQAPFYSLCCPQTASGSPTHTHPPNPGEMRFTCGHSTPPPHRVQANGKSPSAADPNRRGAPTGRNFSISPRTTP